MKIKKSEIARFYKKFSYDETKDLPSASFLFVTRNRSPYADFNKNPLAWSILSLMNGNSSSINEIIVVDDDSTDYTFATIEKLRNHVTCPIKYFKNKKRKGCSYSRQVAIEKSSNEFIFMGDDDCLYNKDFVMGALASYLDIMDKDKSIAVLNLPVYERSTHPKDVEKKENIGKWGIEEVHFYHNFDKFPAEYINDPLYLHNGELAPFKIDIIYGVNLSYKKYILDVGGYDDLSMWDNDYSEHMELSYKLTKNNYSIYHQSDPRFSSIHLKYGAISKDKFDKRSSSVEFSGLKYNLGELVGYSQINKENTGARINNYDFYINQIGSFFSFYVKISRELGVKFALKEYDNFVLNNQVFSTTPSQIFGLIDREDIFKKAINKGIEISTKQKRENYRDVAKTIFSKVQI